MNKQQRNRHYCTVDYPEKEGQKRQMYCIEIKAGSRQKIKLSFAYSAMRQGLLEKLGQAKEELEIRLFTETGNMEAEE